jgi:hypothetical protein
VRTPSELEAKLRVHDGSQIQLRVHTLSYLGTRRRRSALTLPRVTRCSEFSCSWTIFSLFWDQIFGVTRNIIYLPSVWKLAENAANPRKNTYLGKIGRSMTYEDATR